MEYWKDIKGFEGLYQISNYGNIKSLGRKYEYIGKNQFEKTFKTTRMHKEQLIKQIINAKGYYQVCLRKKYKKKNFLVHRLIAEAFIPNPENKPTINHKDGNTLNNSLNNLEWATMKEQINHSINILNHKRIISDKCRIKQKEKHEKKVKRSDGIIFNSIKEASNGNETFRKCINKCVRGKCKTAGGYSWQYI